MNVRLLFLAALAASMLGGAGLAPAQKYGGTLNGFLPINPPSLSLHEESTVFLTWPILAAYNNLVLFDQAIAIETLDTIRPELAESWAWSDDRRALTFKLRPGVKWHDGKPLTARDVKETWDMARGVSKQRFKLNPRKTWWGIIEDVTTEGDHGVTFKLKRPQPSLLAMLASGYSPVLPAHVAPAELRTKTMGSGPFRMTEYQRDRYIQLEKNRDYWVVRRPYLDALRFHIVRNKASRVAVFKTRQVDVDDPTSATKPDMETLKEAVPDLAFHPIVRTSFSTVFFNAKKPPFNDPRLREVVNLALDRSAYIKTVFQGGMVPGGMNVPQPHGAWGLPPEKLQDLPGYGDAAKNKARAREMLKELGYGPNNPFKTEITTRTTTYYVDSAVWVAGELNAVGINATVRQLDTGVVYGMLARRDFQIVFWGTGLGADDPDVNFYENYACGSQRNYPDYCVQEVEEMIDRQSREFDLARRQELVWDVERRLIKDAARIVFGYRYHYNPMQPYVRGLVPHQTNYSYTRMQDVWLDK